MAMTRTYVQPAAIAAAAKAVGFTGDDLVVAVAVALAESGGWLEAVNPLDGTYPSGRRDFGVWQINKVGLSHPELFVLSTNAAAAYSLWQSRKWQPWVTYANGAYLTFMETASAAVQSLSYPPIHLSLLRVGLKNNDVLAYQKALRAVNGGVLAKYNPSGATGYYGTETATMTTHAYADILHLTTGDLTVPGPMLLRYLKFNPLP